MSHFTVMVIGSNPKKQLAPFYEGLEVPRYVEYTKQEMILKIRQEFEDYKNGTYAKFLADTEKYKADCRNESHINYLENEFPKKLNFTDEECYQYGIRYYESENIGADGELYSESNPNSKWDWYQLGGRWAGLIKLKDGIKAKELPNFSWEWTEAEKQEVLKEGKCDYAIKKHIANLNEIVTFALLKDGKWYGRGQMGWWGAIHNEKDDNTWDAELHKLVDELPDRTLISIYDCHI